MQYAMIIDLNRCIGCHSCTVACKAEWNIPADKSRNWVRRLGPAHTPYGIAKTYYPGQCNHCNKPVCVDVCPADIRNMTLVEPITNKTKTIKVAALWKDPFNGTVQLDYDRCIGCGACVDACPYDALYFNPDLGENGKADKCTFCMPRVEKGLQPACVQNCLTGARIFGDLDDINSEVSTYVKKGAKGLTSASVNIGPNTFYSANKKDDHLLRTSSTPEEMPETSLRRSLIARMMPEIKKYCIG